LSALAVSVVLSGCTSVDFDTGQWFQRRSDFFGREGGFTYSELQETAQERPIAARDLVDQSGACAPPPAGAQTQASAVTASNAAPPPAADSQLGGSAALGMSECEVVYRTGQPSSVQIGRNPNGDRTAILTFAGGSRPGIYRFERGRLAEIEGTGEPEAPSPPAKTAKKKPAKSTAAQKNSAQVQ
jgi:hypothetical protein